MALISRLGTAVAEGLISPEGPVCVMRPPADYDLSALPQEGLTVVTTFAPDFNTWQARGFAVDVIASTDCRTVVVVVPRAKALARHMVAMASAGAALVLVDGPKTHGIDSIWRACRARLGDVPSVTKDHGRLFWFSGGDFADWHAQDQMVDGFVTTAGVFSEARIDPGSRLLAESLPPRLPARIAELGAGWGYLSRAILEREGVVSLDLVEAEALALDCARRNVTDPRATFVWADATSWTPKGPLDGVIMNPPFHTGRAGDPTLGQDFITAAARILAPHGKLWMVANRHLPYEAHLRERFRNVDELSGNGAFKVFLATRPTR